MSPTIVYQRGWRIFIFTNEGREPMHVHAVKGDAVCKFWLNPDSFDIREAYAFNLTPALNREVRRIIFDNFDAIVQVWRAR